jgi:hypothetical protein
MAAVARKQAGQRQSPPNGGSGSRTGSAAHQQSPPSAHSKLAPQRSQFSRRGAGGEESGGIGGSSGYALRRNRGREAVG